MFNQIQSSSPRGRNKLDDIMNYVCPCGNNRDWCFTEIEIYSRC